MNQFNGLYSVWFWIKIKFKMFYNFMRNIPAQALKLGRGSQAIWSKSSCDFQIRYPFSCHQDHLVRASGSPR